MNSEPIRHHYIPQFILRNFCFDDRNHLFYFDKKTSKTFVKQTRDVFMVRHLYRDDINNPCEPTKIEKDMACFEREVSEILAKKFLDKDMISITLEEDEKLKLFFAIMGFRSKIVSDKFGIKASVESKAFYSMYQKDGDLTDFWKRNLGNLVNCRSWKEIWNHKEIDDPVKIFFRRDIIGHFGRYFIVVERRGPIDFIISDAYPTVINGVMDCGIQMSLYSIFPISPNRVILLADNGVKGAPKNVVIFSNDVLKEPSMNPDRKSITIRSKKIYEEEVRYVNSSLAEEAHEGFVFRDKNRI